MRPSVFRCIKVERKEMPATTYLEGRCLNAVNAVGQPVGS